MEQLDRQTRWLVELWGNEQEKDELLFGITAETKAELQAYFEHERTVWANGARQREIDATDTRNERPLAIDIEVEPPTVHVLYPDWGAAPDPMSDAVSRVLGAA